MTAQEQIVVVGPGRAGASLARLWRDAGHVVRGFVGLNDHAVAAACAAAGIPTTRLTWADAFGATLAVIAVPDARLDDAVAALTAAARPATTLFIHLAGARGREALAPLGRSGGHTAAFHPLRAFATREPPAGGLNGAVVAIECDEGDRVRLFARARDLRGEPFVLAASNRALYHAGAALGGNAILAVMDTAMRALERAGVPRDVAQRGVAELATGAVENAARLGPADALTGPIVRGDRDVVRRHLEALASINQNDAHLYAELGRALVKLAARRADGSRAASVADLFGEPR